jgi:hypothetical protein
MPSRDGARRAKLAGSPRDYAAAEQGFAGAPLPGFVRSELEEYIDCGLLQRGFALVACKNCPERRLVALSCGSRSFCPWRQRMKRGLNLDVETCPRCGER